MLGRGEIDETYGSAGTSAAALAGDRAVCLKKVQEWADIEQRARGVNHD